MNVLHCVGMIARDEAAKKGTEIITSIQGGRTQTNISLERYDLVSVGKHGTTPITKGTPMYVGPWNLLPRSKLLKFCYISG